MRSDAQLAFVPIGGNLSLVGGAGIGIPSTQVIDLLGQGTGTAPQNIIGNTPSTGFNSGNFGMDVGIGLYKAMVAVFLGAVTVTTANGATLNIQFQGADDTGATGNYQPGAWQTFMETGYMTVAQLNALLPTAATAGALGRFDFPPAFPPGFSPRYLRLLFQPLAATNFTAGIISAAIVTTVRDDQSNKFAAKNYTVS
jgi:hypothetical protein